jgi:hypothetical protein
MWMWMWMLMLMLPLQTNCSNGMSPLDDILRLRLCEYAGV